MAQSVPSAEANKALVRRVYEEGLNQGNLAILDELLADDLADHSLFPGQATGRESFTRRFTLVRTAFPDVTMTVEDAMAEGDKVICRWTLRGTHTGPFASLPATGRSVQISGINITRIAGGRIEEHWASFDHLGLLQQLGAFQPPR
jgi:steroid delta-isomerase-like uncharacterized protein